MSNNDISIMIILIILTGLIILLAVLSYRIGYIDGQNAEIRRKGDKK